MPKPTLNISQVLQSKFLVFTLTFFFFNLLIKTLFINSIPPLLTHDEAYYTVEAQTIIAGLTDPFGTWRPWNLDPANPIYAELTGMVSVPGHLLFPNHPLLAAKFVPILMGSLLPLLLAGIVYLLTDKKRHFYYGTLFVATLNPWLFQFSRMGFDALYSLFFYAVSIFLLLFLKNYHRLWAIVPLFFAFYQYQGGKLLIIPIVFLTSLYLMYRQVQTKEKLKKSFFLPLLTVLLFSFALFIIHWVRLPQLSSDQRMQEIKPFNMAEISQQVDVMRKVTLGSPVKNIFINKYTLALRQATFRSLRNFDPIPLFFQGNTNIDTFAVTRFGYFHLSDILLIMAGLVLLFSKKKYMPTALLISSYIVVGTLPNVIKDQAAWITFRSFFMFAGLTIFAGVGMGLLFRLKSKKLRALFPTLYVLLTLPFFYHYFFAYPVLSAKDTFFYDRVVASYLTRTRSEATTVVSSHPRILFESILGFQQAVTPSNLSLIHQSYQEKEYHLDNFEVAGSCEQIDPQDILIIDYIIGECEGEGDPIRIASLIDSGTKFNVYNDKLCEPYELPRFIHLTSNQLNVESLSDQEFCQTFFIR